MSWSFKIARLAGIDVYVHATFFLLLGWVGLAGFMAGGTDAAIGGLIFILCLFAIVVLHELGHALAARRYGIQTRDIMLLPIGGVARLERMPSDPKQELVIALAGPAVNVVLAAGLFAALMARGWAIGDVERLQAELSTFGGSLVVQLFSANIFLAIFNLIPAFPMDGGRVFRALLAMHMDYVRATQIAATVGQGMAALFVFLGLMIPNLFLVIIAIFVWIGAAAESGAVQFRASLAGVPVRRAMIREFAVLSPTDTLADAARKTLDGFQTEYPVVVDGQIVGILTRNELIQGLTESGPNVPVANYMRTDFTITDPDEMVERVFERLKEGDSAVLPVVDHGQLVGLLTASNVAELVMFREALRNRAVRGGTFAG